MSKRTVVSITFFAVLVSLLFAPSALAAGDAWVNKEGKLVYKGGKTANQITLKFESDEDYPWVISDATGKVTARNLKGESKCTQVKNAARCRGVGAKTSVIYLQEGNDKADIQASADVRASVGDDVITISNARVVVDGFKGNDKVSAKGGNVRIDGGLGNDNLSSEGGKSRLIGNFGDDVLAAQGGRAVVNGGDGNDMLYGKSDKALVKVYGEKGTDTIGLNGDKAYGYGQDDNDTIGVGDGAYGAGNSGDDTITTSGAGSRVAGGPGNDSIEGDAKTMRAGGGNDSLTVSGSTEAFGGNDADRISSSGKVKIHGGEGDDRIRHKIGAAQLFGGSGADQITFNGRVQVGGGPGRDLIRGSSSEDSSEFRTRLRGGPENDWIIGTSGFDKIRGGDGSDTIIGLGSYDRIRGERGKDVISVAGFGRDWVRCESSDTVISSQNDNVIGCASTVRTEKWVCSGTYWTGLGNGPDRRTPLSTTDDFARGWGGRDILQGSDGSDCIFGDAGNDVLSGDDFRDILIGGPGSDILLAGSGIDYLVGDGPAVSRPSGNVILAVDAAKAKRFADTVTCSRRDTVVVDEYDRVRGCRPIVVPENHCTYWGGQGKAKRGLVINGNARPQTFRGWKGPDRINAAAGNDCLISGGGADKISGGQGNDHLYPGGGRDRISGGAGDDKIFAVDNRRDTINCGTGTDSVVANKRDRVAKNCEKVIRRR